MSASPSKAGLYGHNPSVQGVALKGEPMPILAGVQSGILTKTQSRILFANNQPNPSKSKPTKSIGIYLQPGRRDAPHLGLKKNSTLLVGPQPLHLVAPQARASARQLKAASISPARLIDIRQDMANPAQLLVHQIAGRA